MTEQVGIIDKPKAGSEILDFQNHRNLYGRLFLASYDKADKVSQYVNPGAEAMIGESFGPKALDDRDYNPVLENLSRDERANAWKGIKYQEAYTQWKGKFTQAITTITDEKRLKAIKLIFPDKEAKEFTPEDADTLFKKFSDGKSNVHLFIKNAITRLTLGDKIDTEHLRELLPHLQWLANGLFGKDTAQITAGLIELESNMLNDPFNITFLIAKEDLVKGRVPIPQSQEERDALRLLYSTLNPKAEKAETPSDDEDNESKAGQQHDAQIPAAPAEEYKPKPNTLPDFINSLNAFQQRFGIGKYKGQPKPPSEQDMATPAEELSSEPKSSEKKIERLDAQLTTLEKGAKLEPKRTEEEIRKIIADIKKTSGKQARHLTDAEERWIREPLPDSDQELERLRQALVGTEDDLKQAEKLKAQPAPAPKPFPGVRTTSRTDQAWDKMNAEESLMRLEGKKPLATELNDLLSKQSASEVPIAVSPDVLKKYIISTIKEVDIQGGTIEIGKDDQIIIRGLQVKKAMVNIVLDLVIGNRPKGIEVSIQNDEYNFAAKRLGARGKIENGMKNINSAIKKKLDEELDPRNRLWHTENVFIVGGDVLITFRKTP